MFSGSVLERCSMGQSFVPFYGQIISHRPREDHACLSIYQSKDESNAFQEKQESSLSAHGRWVCGSCAEGHCGHITSWFPNPGPTCLWDGRTSAAPTVTRAPFTAVSHLAFRHLGVLSPALAGPSSCGSWVCPVLDVHGSRSHTVAPRSAASPSPRIYRKFLGPTPHLWNRELEPRARNLYTSSLLIGSGSPGSA